MNKVFNILDARTGEPVESPVARVIWERVATELPEDTVLVSRTGKEIPIGDSVAPILNDEGSISGVVLTFSDMTERKKLEEQLEQSRKLETVRRLADGVGHDFNTLLSNILAHTDLMLKGLGHQDPLRETAGQIMKSAKRAAGLIRQLLDLSRQQALRPEAMDLNQMIADMEEMLRGLMGERIALEKVLAPDLGKVEADGAQIQRVIKDLVVHATEAMPQGGKIIIETANMDLDEAYGGQREEAEPGSYVMMTVSDTGIGMESEVLSNIFEPFFATEDFDKGTGQGLATVYAIVKQSNGYIWVDSEPGRGTTFTVFLPRVLETVLLVEADTASRNRTRNLLELSGYNTLEAEDVEEALELCRSHQGPIHLLMTDSEIPQMSRGELNQRLQSVRPVTKVLYVWDDTGHAALGDEEIDHGDEFIQRPFSLEALSSKVRQVLDRPKGKRR